MNLVDKMKEIADTLNVYDQKISSTEKDCQNRKAKAANEHQNRKQSIEQQRDVQINDANQRKGKWEEEVFESRRYMQKMQDSLKERAYAASFGGKVLGSVGGVTFDNIIEKLERMDRKEASTFRAGDNDELIRIAKNIKPIMQKFEDDQAKIAQAIQQQYSAEISYSQKSFNRENAKEEARFSKQNGDIDALLHEQRKSINTHLIEQFNTRINPQEIKKEYEKKTESIPTYDNYAPPEAFPEEIVFGDVAYEITDDLKDSVKKQVLIDSCNTLISTVGRRTFVRFPYGYSFTDYRFSSLFEFDSRNREQIISHMQTLILRLMMSIPCKKAWLTLIDPIELGNTFSLFAPWGDIEERVIDTRIWHEEGRIEERLQTIIDHTSDVHIRCLQGKYKNIIEYNEHAGKNAEPLRFIFIMDFPRKFTQSALDKLESIIVNGPSTGVFAIIAGDVNEISADLSVSRIIEKINVFSFERGLLFAPEAVNNRALRFMPLSLGDKDKVLKTIDKISDGLKEPDPPVFPADVYRTGEQPMTYDASNGISIPLGLEGANKLIELKLGGVSEGGKGRSYHAMVGGSIGSGKSSMLHAIIMGILHHYSPNEVQLYLVDMKEGVEFKKYAQHMGLANLHIVAIEAEKDFGLAVLQELTNEQGRRGQKFKEMQTDRIETYNRKMREENRMSDIMPRLIVVIDEIQWMFDEAEDPITKECARLLESLILMGGSAFGIQLILATQDWNNVVGVRDSIYNNIGVRIAKRSTRESAQKLLASDNEVITRLVTYDQRQAIFNEYSGHKDYNREFRAVYFTPEKMNEWMNQIAALQRQQELNSTFGFQRVLSSDIQDHDDNPLNIFAKDNKVIDNATMSYRLFIGESLGLINTFYPIFKAKKGNNLLMIGGRERDANTIVGFVFMSLLMESIRLGKRVKQPVLTIFDFSSPNQYYDYSSTLLNVLFERLPRAVRVFKNSDVLEGLEILENEIESNDDNPQHFVVFFGLNRARRLIEGGAYDEKPRDRLAKLFHIGPEKGVNFVVWANSPSAFQQFYNDTLFDFELRLVLDGTEEEMYPYFIQDKKPATADTRNAISYNLDGENQIIKLYTQPSEKWVDEYVKSANRFLD